MMEETEAGPPSPSPPPTLDYRAVVPKEPWRPDDTQKSLAEGFAAAGCAMGAVVLLVLVMICSLIVTGSVLLRGAF